MPEAHLHWNETVETSPPFDLRSAKAKAVGALALLATLYLFSLSLREPRSPEQLAYDAWLAGKQQVFAKLSAQTGDSASPNMGPTLEGEALAELPTLRLELKASSGGEAKLFELKSSKDAANAEQIVRLLELIREADLFSLSARNNPKDSSPWARITIQERDRTFSAEFSAGQIADNMPAQLLLTLFKEYAAKSPN